MFRTVSQLCFTRSYPILNIHLLLSTGIIQEKKISSSNDEVRFHYINKTGIIQLNKPETLNALSFPMVRQIYSKMKEWELDGKTELVIIKSNGSKAFCAGGDIKALVRVAKTSDIEKFLCEGFQDEYQLNYLIGNYKLPYVAFINGITMGGGWGLSVHGPFRIATEATIAAMPETAVGLFPDVGCSHFLPRLSNNLGAFLGLTSHRLRGIDVVHAGIATHFVPTNRLEEVEQKLVQIPKANHTSVKQILDENSESIKSQSAFNLQKHLPLINRVFSLDSKNVETIFEQLKSDGSDFALKQLSILKKMSPTSLKITFQQLKYGKQIDLRECLKMEYRIAQDIVKNHDFFEGVRAVLVDKDNKPQWQPSSLEDISDKEIAHYFEQLSPKKELQLP